MKSDEIACILQAFTQAIHKGPSSQIKAVAEHLGIPYLEERQGERLLGHRLKEGSKEDALKQGLLPTRQFRSKVTGEVLCTDTFPSIDEYEQLTEEVWSEANWPTSCNSLEAGLQKAHTGVVGMYFHMPSLNLVLVTVHLDLVGIRLTSLRGRREILTEGLLRLRPAKA